MDEKTYKLFRSIGLWGVTSIAIIYVIAVTKNINCLEYFGIPLLTELVFWLSD